MLSLLAAHIIISFSCLVSGLLFYTLFGKQRAAKPLVYYLISGLVLLTMLAQLVVLFFPVGLYTQLSFTVVILLYALLQRRAFVELLKKLRAEFATWPALSLLLFFISWLIVLLINAGPVIMDDTESYHLQSIKWIQEYGTVPGLVNLHERFGFNSSWFSCVALFWVFK